MKEKECCQQDIATTKSAALKTDIMNTTVDIDQWKTPCVVSIPMFFIVLKLNISFIVHVSIFDGIIFSIKVLYDLEVLAQIDTACARVDCYCIQNMM